MASEWVITAAADHIVLDAHRRGEMTFTVTNASQVQDRVVLEAVPGDGASGLWFTVEQPQRLVPGGASVSYLLKTAVPDGTAAGSYWVQGRAYSTDAAPEESSRLSGRVSFDVSAAVAPRNRWWPYAVAAALVMVVLAVVCWLVLRP